MRATFTFVRILCLCLLCGAGHAFAETQAPEPIGIEPLEEGTAESPFPLDIVPQAEDSGGDYVFDDQPRKHAIVHPDWFKENVADLRAELDSAKRGGKEAGLILYFSQRNCAYCEALLETSFNRADVEAYTRKYFDVLMFDILSDTPLKTFAGEELTQAQFATRNQTNLTPALLFYDKSGQERLRLRGYYPPYIIIAALDYMVGNSYAEEDFPSYLARSRRSPELAAASGLNFDPRFMPPPYLLNTLPRPKGRILTVFFEQPQCHACDILHNELLGEPKIAYSLEQMDLVQLNVNADIPLVTPSGERTTARRWAEKLGVFYTPTMVFFDNTGAEVFRVDSVVRLHRLAVALEYILDEGYKDYPDNLQGWFFMKATRQH